MEITNTKKIIFAKCISLFTHILRTNYISDAQVDRIDIEVRKAIRRKVYMHNASSTYHFHLPLTYGGLGIPSFKTFSDEIRIKTALYLINNENQLFRNIYTEGIKHENSIFSEMKESMQRYNLKFKLLNETDNLEKLKGRNFTIYTDGSKINSSTGFGISINPDKTIEQGKREISYRIDDNYSLLHSNLQTKYSIMQSQRSCRPW